ncbi:SP family arabinose:H+ symporter-like MFS transporter [Maribacter vaceletii]|uniref:SP family arabinose:H+ symporter-like MFS transporter n=1 Tax=Maribacter vaceletii TaxID=1206816 RepID=A0A495DU74_9FLAO|nr:sugar porter family MFS transporter [Maribacter vaceletii]RKR07998.1 SP family arabinose:H+ symporter-like MFS transporter [Maribacter vaceletii]
MTQVTSTEVKKSSLYLWFICIVAACGGLLFGYDAVVVSGTNTQVVEQFNFSKVQLGFYVSCVLWGCAIGSGVAGPISDNYGRKKTLMMASILIFISASWSGLASSPLDLIIARLIGGLGIGAATMVCPLYISEVAPENLRGRMVTLFQLTITIGIVMCVFSNWGIFNFSESQVNSNTLSPFWKLFVVNENWRLMFMAEAIPGVLFLGCTFFIPESPRWLIKRYKDKEAKSILTRINGSKRAEEILSEIKETFNEDSKVKFFDLFGKKLKKPLILAVLICILSEACGVSVIFYYGPQIFESAGFDLGGSLGGFASIAIVNFIATIFALGFIDSAGRRKLLTVGAIGALLSHVSIGILFMNNITGWPIVIAINSFIAFFACAIGPVKFVIVSEIFPNQVRGKAIALATVCIWITSALVAQVFPIIEDVTSPGVIYLLFALELCLLLLVIKFMMPETKGRTIEDIERSWLK